MEERGNKTIMCSVMFLDIVAYSRKSVSAQIAQKELFNRVLGNAIEHVPAEDRVILDTGDGAAITFLGDVEDALRAALSFRDGLLAEDAQMDPPLQVRVGINLGPVRLVKDINGRPNIVGDGINVAQRVMGFAKDGQILASRSYVDGAARLSQEYAGMFHRVGMRADKHDRVHEVYSIGPSDGVEQTGEDTLDLAMKLSPIESATGKVRVMMDKFMNAPPQRRALYASISMTALTLLIVIGVKISGRQTNGETQPDAIFASPSALDSASAVQPSASLPAPAATPADTGSTEQPVKEETKKHHKDKAAADKKKDNAQTDTSKPKSSSKATGSATINIIVTPWGEIYLDGNKQGVSPPMDDLRVSAGKHIIEIRNTTFPPYTLSIDVKDGEKLKIKHKFGY